MNVVVTGGGTGGHFYPAYILYEKLKNSGKIAEIYYFGSDYGIEKKLVAELNLNYRLLKARGFIGKSVFDKIKAIILNFYSILYCLYFFLKNKVDAVVAAGGYVSLPSLTAAVILRKKIYIQEQNSYPGITTRLFAFAAKYVFIAFPEAKNYLKIDSEKIILSITPVRDDFIEKTGNLIEKPKTLTIIGGSQGSKKLNEIVAELKDFLKKESLNVNWITGANFYDKYKSLETENIKIFAYRSDIYKLIAESELIISRAGATSIAEYSILNKKVLFIPFEAATHNHQYYNALSYIKEYCGDIILEKDLNVEILKNKIRKLLAEPKNIKSKTTKNPADFIAQKIIESIY